MLEAIRRHLGKGGSDRLLSFEDSSGRQVDFDYTGAIAGLLSGGKAEPAVEAAAAGPGGTVPETAQPKGRGRPRLGVTGGQVSLFPRDWEWLESQKSGISATLRRLVDEARRSQPRDRKEKQAAMEACGTFLTAMAGNLPGYEEASRSLYARDSAAFAEHTATWPADIRKYAFQLVGWNLPPATNGGKGGGRAWGNEVRELPGRSARELAGLVDAGEVSALEVVESHLSRIWRMNPAVNAVTEVFADQAREAAKAFDRRRQQGEAIPPLAGVPFTVKANIDVAGTATTHGVPALRNMMAPLDAPVVERLRRAGGIPLAHTNLPDMSLRFHTRSSLYGATVNPWNAGMSPGGSSGGEAVAMATGMSALGIGNDAGGSVRLPALFAGVCSLKPGYGRLPSDRSAGPRELTLASQWIPVEGLIARCVADLGLAFSLLCGPDPRDPRVVPNPHGPAPDTTGLRVGLIRSSAGSALHPDVLASLEAARGALVAAGYTVDEVDPPRLEEALETYGRLIMTEFNEIWPALQRLLGKDGQRYVELAMADRPPASLSEYIALTAKRHSLQQAWAAFAIEYPVLLAPVFALPAVPVDYDIQGALEFSEIARGMALCSLTSFLGLPAVSVPTGLFHGLPGGVQVIGPWFREDLCLAVAASIEERLGTVMLPEPS